MSDDSKKVKNEQGIFKLSHEAQHTWLLQKVYLSDDGAWGTKVREAINKNIKKDFKGTLWHYCPLQAMEGIIKSKKFFMSDLSTMNDYKEGKWLRGKITERLSSTSRQFLPYLDSTNIDFLLNPFVLSLSEDGDILSQWRAYAAGGKGIALGLETSLIQVPVLHVKQDRMQGQMVLVNVIYDEEVQELIIEHIVHIIESIVKSVNSMKELKYKPENHPFIPSAANINMNLRYIEPLFKNPAFREENEWRIIYFPDTVVKSKWKNNEYEIDFAHRGDIDDLKFRFREDSIIPYYLFPKELGANSAIKRIILGPLCNVDRMSLALFLNSYGISSFSVGRSLSTLR